MSKIRDTPRDLHPDLYRMLEDMRKAIEATRPSSIQPGTPTNLTVTPQPMGNLIDFIAGRGADKHTLFISLSPKWDATRQGSVVIDLGNSTHYPHFVGQGGVQRYYWIMAEHAGGKSPMVGPKAGLTLAFNTAGVTPVRVPQSQDIVHSQRTGQPTVLVPRPTGGKGIND